MGDRELYDVLAASLDRQSPPTDVDGTRWYDGLSTNMNAMLAMSRVNPPGGHRALIEDGPGKEVLRGPVLERASYPDVLVAAARTDGRDLRLVLRPGAGPTRTQLGIDRLVPLAPYRVSGALVDDVVADDHGRITITADLAGRTEVCVTPAP
jgi:hypothetical protein